MNLPTAPSNPPSSSSSNNNHNNTSATTPPHHDYSFGQPSKSRRELLKLHNETTSPIPLSNLTPITKYYTAASKVLSQFKHHLSHHELDDAYIIGRRFATFSTVSLPSHDYYSSPRYVKERIQNAKDAEWVLKGLERIVEVMDREEWEKMCKEEERRKKEEVRMQIEWEQRMKQRLESTGITEHSNDNLQKDENDVGLLDSVDCKLNKLNVLFPKNGNDVAAATEQNDDKNNGQEQDGNIQHLCDNMIDNVQIQELPPPIIPPLNHNQDDDLLLFYSMDATQQLKSDGKTPMFNDDTQQQPPPSYSDLFLDTLKTPSKEDEEQTTLLPTSTPITEILPIRTLRSNSTDQFHSLQSTKRIEIIKLSTYQGRLSHTPQYDSTNGCTVISPLIVATHISPHHYTTTHPQYKLGISNTEIQEIIDKRCIPILTCVRKKLGLNNHALIIPSDVHDYLVDEGILSQDKFVGVCGGNLLDRRHWNVLVDMLLGGKGEEGGKNLSKVGAGEFFLCIYDHCVQPTLTKA